MRSQPDSNYPTERAVSLTRMIGVISLTRIIGHPEELRAPAAQSLSLSLTHSLSLSLIHSESPSIFLLSLSPRTEGPPPDLRDPLPPPAERERDRKSFLPSP